MVESKSKDSEPLVRKLTRRKTAVLRLSSSESAEAITTKLTDWLAEGPIQGVYFLPGMDVEPLLSDMNLQDWQAGLEQRLYSLYTIMRSMPEETFLVCATRAWAGCTVILKKAPPLRWVEPSAVSPKHWHVSDRRLS